MLAAYARLGGKWGQVGQELSRSGLGCRNRFALSGHFYPASDMYDWFRWRLLERKGLTAGSKVNQIPPTEEDPAPNIWAPTPVLDAAQYWDGREHHSQYDPNCSEFTTDQLSGYVRTQHMNAARSGMETEAFQVSGMPELASYIPPFNFRSYSFDMALSSHGRSDTQSVDRHHSTVGTSSFDSECSAQANTSPPPFSSHSSLSHVDDSQYQSIDDDMQDSHSEFSLPSEQPRANGDQVFTNSTCATPSLTPFHEENPTSNEPEAPPSNYLLQTIPTNVLDVSSVTISNDPLPLPPPSTAAPQFAATNPSNIRPSHGSHSHSSYYRPSPGDRPKVSTSKRRTNSEIPRRLNADLSLTPE